MRIRLRAHIYKFHLLNKEKLHNLYNYSNTMTTKKSRRVRQVRHTACTEEVTNAYKTILFSKNIKRKKTFEDPGTDMRIILKWILIT